MTIDYAFFGCWGGVGHFLFDKGKNTIHDPEREKLPRDSDLDGSRLFLPYPEQVGFGRCTYLPALNVTVLSWWNRVIDERGAVNSHVIVRGNYETGTMWNIFLHQFPEVAKLHTKPIIAVTY